MTTKIKVECLECGKKFATASLSPVCPRCGGVDIDIREHPEMIAAAERSMDATRERKLTLGNEVSQ